MPVIVGVRVTGTQVGCKELNDLAMTLLYTPDTARIDRHLESSPI